MKRNLTRTEIEVDLHEYHTTAIGPVLRLRIKGVQSFKCDYLKDKELRAAIRMGK